MEFKNLILEKKEKIAIVTINRPKVLNALNTETLLELDLAIEAISKDNEVYVVILKGGGEKAFVAGADILEMKDMKTNEGRLLGILGNKVFRKLELLDKPVICAIQGFALGGGCELSLACDIRIASKKARFAQPEVGLGITPGFGGTQRLARLIGESKAKELIFTARIVDAEEALRIGLVNCVVESESLMKETLDLASKIAEQAPMAVRFCKTAINRGIQCDIDTGIMYESEIFAQCFSTEDQKEGMNAFIEKRQKHFKNR
jgi:enoyl-CoA hydratase